MWLLCSSSMWVKFAVNPPWMRQQADKEEFARALEGYNVVAILHGHEHRVGHYVWRGHPVFRPGAPRHSSRSFLAVRLGAREMAVAAWDFDRRQWLESWVVPVRRGRP